MQKPVMVIKLGTAVLTNSEGIIKQKIIDKVAEGIAGLSKWYHIILVSSGAVGSGKGFIKNYRGTLKDRKAAAAIGNPILIQKYQKSFSKYGITIAQALCERHHFSNRVQYLQLQETFGTLWNSDVVPVVNENDIVSNVEIKFSDNDELATLLAIAFNAGVLLIATSVGGLLNDRKQIIQRVEKIDQRVQKFISQEKSSLGLGGMLSKLTFAKLATSLGIRVIFCGLNGDAPFKEALSGSNGTDFIPSSSTLKARQKWLANGSITLGSLIVDAGAVKALQQRRSLLTVGVKDATGKFECGEVVQIVDADAKIIGVAKAKLSKAQVLGNISNKNVLAAHADDIVLF